MRSIASIECDGQSDHAGACQQSRDIQLKDALPDEEHGHDCEDDLQELPRDVDHERIETVVGALRECAHLDVEQRNKLESGAGSEQRDPREEEPCVERIKFRQRVEHRQQKEEDDA